MLGNVPAAIRSIAAKLLATKYEAHLVGGCVRDILIGREPKDWDIATDAKPEDIQAVFPESIYENSFGTVAVKLKTENPPQQNKLATG